MDKMVYQFLDKYIGDGVNVSDKVLMYDPNDFMPQDIYFISSNNNTRIIEIRFKDNVPSLVYEQKLGSVVSNFFSISMITSHSYIISWFKERTGIKDLLWDLKKIIDERR